MGKFEKIIPCNEHVLVCGATGTGKSRLAEYYTLSYKYVVKLDTKDEVSERKALGIPCWFGLEENKDYTIVRDFFELENVETPKIIFAPDYLEQTKEMLDDFFLWIYNRGNTVLWVDEVLSFSSANSYPRNYARLLIMGRSKNVGLWNCSQRPSGIPTLIPANCKHFFIFDTNTEADRTILYKNTGQRKLLEFPNGHNFFYYKMGSKTVSKGVLKM